MTLDRLPILILYPHSRCNCRCLMCEIWRRTETEELTARDIDGWSEDLRALGVEQIVLSGGEPLMHSNLRGLGKALKTTGATLTLLTTGLRLAEEAEIVNELFDEAIVSLDGPRAVHDDIRRVPGAFDRLASGVRAIRVPAHGRCTVQKANHAALCETADAAREVGLQSISYLAVDTASTAFDHDGAPHSELGLDAEEVEMLAAEVERLIVAEPSFVRESPEKLRGIVRRFRARLGQAPPQAPPCTAPWVSAVVETDGTLRPCFFHEPVGNVREQGLLGALNSDKAVRFREGLDVGADPVCRNCVCSLNRPFVRPGSKDAVATTRDAAS